MNATRGFRRTRSLVECRLGLEDFAALLGCADGAALEGALLEREGVIDVNYGPPWQPVITAVIGPPLDADIHVLALDRLVSFHIERCRAAVPDRSRIAALFERDALVCRNGCADTFGAMSRVAGAWLVVTGHNLGDVLAASDRTRPGRQTGVHRLSFPEREDAEAAIQSELGPQNRILFDTRSVSTHRLPGGYGR
jgi:hypothetical protein